MQEEKKAKSQGMLEVSFLKNVSELWSGCTEDLLSFDLSTCALCKCTRLCRCGKWLLPFLFPLEAFSSPHSSDSICESKKNLENRKLFSYVVS